MYTATYSPEDNKLRLYSSVRLDKGTYLRVKSAGFSWAPKQELFVAPAWTPNREDLLLELAGEVGDEDTSLVERAEERAERFEDYSERRSEDAERARAAVASIADGIPLGQPILIGHHSERRARKDAEKIENGMRKAVNMWKTSQYWEQRAKGAIRHAKYKELPAVRYRRIKGLEADKRKEEKSIQTAEMWLKLWTDCSNETDRELQLGVARRLAGMCHLYLPRKEGDRPDFDGLPTAYGMIEESGHPSLYVPRTREEVFAHALASYPRRIAGSQRWLDHYNNRIAYERAMLEEQGGLKGEQFDYRPGGQILRRGYWLPILKVNRRGGVVQSVTVSGHFASTVSVDEIRDYRAPEGDAEEKVKAATKLPPMCNYPGEGFRHMTTKEWKARHMSDVPQSQRHTATATHGVHRTRSTAAPQWSTVAVYLTDSKRIDPPAPKPDGEAPVKLERVREIEATPKSEQMADFERAHSVQPARASFEEIEQALKQGVKVITAPQLFPTPAPLAARMIELADIQEDHRVLEPSAGSGNILRMIPNTAEVVAVEMNTNLFRHLLSLGLADVHNGDFLEQNGNLGKFDRIVMNPPFANAEDIKHIKHARQMLKPGGLLVAICAGGPRQERELKPLAATWEPLPAGTFEDSGTNVSTVLLTMDACPECEATGRVETGVTLTDNVGTTQCMLCFD